MNAPLTRSTTFGSIGPNAPSLFSVADGVSLEAALETASSLTEGVIDIAKGVACRIGRADGAAELWAGIHALESVAAILEAIQAGLLDLERPEPTSVADEFDYYVAPSDHTALGPFQWFVVNDANERVVEYGTADTWSDADQVACDTIERLEQEAERSTAGASKEGAQ